MQELCQETINDSDRALLHDIAQGKFAFVDFGCGTGESIGYCQKRFGLGPGFGIEVSERKLQQARKSGHAVIAADVTETTLPEGCVSFCTMLDFLEHLPSQDAGAAVLRSAGRIARDFLFVRHPSFEDIDYLAGLGLKLDWTDWIGHKNMMRLGDFAKVFRGLSWDEYVIIPQKQILDSSHPAVVPLAAPTDTVQYDAEKHGPKPLVYFNRPIWTQFDMFVRLNPAMDEKAWRRVLASVSLLEQHASLTEVCARQTEQLAAGQTRISSLEGELNQVLTSKRYAAGTAMAEIFNRAAPDFAKPAALRAAATIYVGGRQLGGYLHRAISYPRVRKDGAWRALPGGFPPPAMPRAHLERLRVDIVVCVRDSLDDVQRCLASIDETRLPTHRVIIVDDGSGLETKRILKQYVAAHPGDLLIRHDMSHGYTKAANAGLRQADGDYVILLNSDTVVAGEWILKLLECGESDEKVGIVGPMSNAASWQSVPQRFDTLGDWTVNHLPEGFTVVHLDQLVELQSDRRFPSIPVVNGFCFAIKRAVLDAIGHFDEEVFPHGYGEENDYCFRASDAGFACAIATHTYVFHGKSKSYSHERRRALSKRGTEAMRRKHSAERLARATRVMRTEATLTRLRERVDRSLRTVRDRRPELEALFVLPIKGAGGGTHSVIQEVIGLRRLGVAAQAAVPEAYRSHYLLNYDSEFDLSEIILSYRDDHDLVERAGRFGVCIATTYESVTLLCKIAREHAHILPAYYVQDYEPLFLKQGSRGRARAEQSYTEVADALLFAKTRWLCRTVEEKHGVRVHKVAPSLDRATFFAPSAGNRSVPVRVAAMVRVQTPRRAPHRTMRLLGRLARELGDAVEVHIFGTNPSDFARAGLAADFPARNHGVLARRAVADLLRETDVFADFSDYQAFGRTGLEAMACGSAVILPIRGGTDEYARHGTNALLVDTESDERCGEALRALVRNESLRSDLKESGLKTAARYSIEGAALSELILLESAWQRHCESGRVHGAEDLQDKAGPHGEARDRQRGVEIEVGNRGTRVPSPDP